MKSLKPKGQQSRGGMMGLTGRAVTSLGGWATIGSPWAGYPDSVEELKMWARG